MGPPKDVPLKRPHITTAPQDSNQFTPVRPTTLGDQRRDDWVSNLVAVGIQTVFDAYETVAKRLEHEHGRTANYIV